MGPPAIQRARERTVFAHGRTSEGGPTNALSPHIAAKQTEKKESSMANKAVSCGLGWAEMGGKPHCSMGHVSRYKRGKLEHHTTVKHGAHGLLLPIAAQSPSSSLLCSAQISFLLLPFHEWPSSVSFFGLGGHLRSLAFQARG